MSNIHEQLPTPATSSSPDDILRLDDVTLFSIDIVPLIGDNIPIREHCAGISINENLFENHMQGGAIQIDAVNLPGNVPLTGSEVLEVIFESKGGELVMKPFLIDKLLKRSPGQNRQSQIYDISFVCPSFAKNMFEKVSKSYKNMPISAMVEDIFKNYIFDSEDRESGFSLLTVEPTQGNQNIIIPNLSPIKAINWLAKRAISASTLGGADYVFYQDFNGFHFHSVSILFEQDVKREFVFGVTESEDVKRDSPTHAINIEDTVNNIRNLQINGFDRSEETMAGAFASTLTYHNIIGKSIHTVTYDYFSNFENKGHLNEHPLIGDLQIYDSKPNTKHYLIPVHNGLYGEPSPVERNTGNDGALFTIQRHDANIIQVQSSSIEFDVAGDSSTRVGDKISVLIHSFEAPDESGRAIEDNILTGNYIIMCISHLIGRKGHTMRLKLCKDSHIKKLPGSNQWADNMDAGSDSMAGLDGSMFA